MECSPDIGNGDAIYWCKKCKESVEHEHKRERFRGFAGDVDKEGVPGDK